MTEQQGIASDPSKMTSPAKPGPPIPKKYLTHAEEQWYAMMGSRHSITEAIPSNPSLSSSPVPSPVKLSKPIVSPHQARYRKPGSIVPVPIQTSSLREDDALAVAMRDPRPPYGSPPAPRKRPGPPPRAMRPPGMPPGSRKPPPPRGVLPPGAQLVRRGRPPPEVIAKLRAKGPPKHSPKHQEFLRQSVGSVDRTITPQDALAAAASANAAFNNAYNRQSTMSPQRGSRFAASAQMNIINTQPPIDHGWIKLWDQEAEATYYFNENTGEATWLKPDNFTDPMDSQQENWEQYWDEDEQMWYMHNSETGESRWVESSDE